MLGISSMLETIGTTPTKKTEWSKLLTNPHSYFYHHTLAQVTRCPQEQPVTT